MATLAHTKTVLVLSRDAQACHAATSALAKKYSVYATPCERDDVTRYIMKMKPDAVLCDLDILRAVSASTRLVSAADVSFAKDSSKPFIDIGASSTTVELNAPTDSPAIIAFLEADQEIQILEVFDNGAEDYIFKPILEDELKSKVDGLFEQPSAAIPSLIPSSKPNPKRAPKAVFDSAQKIAQVDLPEKRLALIKPIIERPKKTIVGNYELGNIVGQGGYGVVYRAIERSTGQVVALKMLPKEAGSQPESVARFFRESSAIGRLNHPNIVKFFESDSYQGRFFFTMELVEGVDLKDQADAQAPFDLLRASNYIAQVACGLAAISSLGFVHRDVKPENMLLCRDGHVKLIDFGLVKIVDAVTITCDNDVLGTPYYMGPEYIAGGTELDVRYDIYSLGVTFYVFLTGHYPFVGRNTAHVLEKHIREAPPHARMHNPKVPEVIDRLIIRMLAKRPKDRPSPKELVDELAALLGHRVLGPLDASDKDLAA
jgi:CheY-like chemotaxis protein